MTNSLPTVPGLERPSTPVEALSSENQYHIAVVIDGVVYQILQTNGKNAAIFLANPTFIQINQGDAQMGYTYNPTDGTFSAEVL